MPNKRPDATPLLRRFARLALGSLLAFSFATAHALDPEVKLVDYNHTIWTAKDGAPGAITAMAQTRDGWLWLGTRSGLYRFDGVRFSTFAPPAGMKLPGSGISNLYAADDGGLLVGYIAGGASVIHGDKLVHIATKDQLSTTMRAEVDKDGSVWIATVRGLIRLRDGVWTKIGPEHGFPATAANSLFIDQDGRLLVSSAGNDVYLLDRQRDRFEPLGVPGGARTIVSAPDGSLWTSDDKSWRRLPLPPCKTASDRNWHIRTDAGTGLFDRDGNHWALRCPTGLCRVAPSTWRTLARFDAGEPDGERLDQRWQLGSMAPNAVFEDREGNIWIGSQFGLERFRHNRLASIPLPVGEDEFQLVRDDGGKALAVSMHTGATYAADGTRLGQREPQTMFASGLDGSLLWADSTHVQRIKNGRTSDVGKPPGPDGLPLRGRVTRLVGNDVEIWAAVVGGGVFRWRDGTWTAARELKLPSGVTAMNMMPDGSTWFAFRNGSVMRFVDGRVDTIVKPGDSPIGFVLQIDATQGIVIAGEEGVAVVEHGRVHVLRSDAPEALAGVTGMLRTANGDRWFNGRKGAVRVEAMAWEAALADPDRSVRTTIYDNLDGYIASAVAYATYPTITQTADGKLWFVSQAGVLSLNPARLGRNSTPPPVIVGPIQAPESVRAADGIVTLPAGTTSVHLDYTALSYTKPERIQFRYRLDGVDDTWQDAGTRRSAFYTRLVPGTYRFRVTAINEDGVPSTHEASTEFTIAPTLAQTTWFRLLCALLAVALLALAYRWRTRRLAQRLNERFQERLAERERISRALHDTLLQNMQALILRLHAAVKPMERGGETRGRIDAILDQADTVMAEARQELKELRDRGDGSRTDIGHALAAFGATLQEQFGAEFKLFVGGTARPLQGVAWQEIYYIGREALFNAYQHAHARKIEVELTYGNGEFGLVVRDDGRGIDDDIQQRGGRDGHWGLPGMKERAAGLGGTLEWWSRAGLGTEVIARFPAARVYAPEEKQRWRRRLRALLGRTGA